MSAASTTNHAFASTRLHHSRQPIIGGVYRPLANRSTITSPTIFCRHGNAKLYVQKQPIHNETSQSRTSLYVQSGFHIPSAETTPEEFAIKTWANETSKRLMDTTTTIADNYDAAFDSTPSIPDERTAIKAVCMAKETYCTVTEGCKAIVRTIKTAAATVHNAWHTFTQLKAVQLIIKFFQSTYPLWKKRHRFSYSFYAIIIAALSAFEVIFIQWGMYSEPEYEKGVEIDKTTRILDSVAGQTTKFVTQMWLEQKNLVLLNFIILIAIYLTLIFILNRFWVSTAIFGAVMTTYAVANHVKMQTRNEPVLPADLNFITGGNTSELTSFIPKSSQGLVNSAVTGVTWLVIICIIMQFIDGRNGIIHCAWRRPFASVKNFTGTLTRIAAAVCSVALCFSFVWGFGDDGYWSTQFAQSMGDSPQIWNGLADSTSNGPVVNFLRLAHTKTMDKPEGYSQETIQAIAKKYAKQAQQINKTRNTNMTDNTVIMMLSETFSDPTRVPGVSFSEDPIPNIRQIKTQTTSGLMLTGIRRRHREY